MIYRRISIAIFATVVGISCNTSTTKDSEEETITPVFVTVAGHIEDSLIYTDCVEYDDYRSKLITFANTISDANVAFNLQVSYEWFVGVSNCETEDMKALTDGKNIIDYLVESHDFEIDVHFNYDPDTSFS